VANFPPPRLADAPTVQWILQLQDETDLQVSCSSKVGTISMEVSVEIPAGLICRDSIRYYFFFFSVGLVSAGACGFAAFFALGASSLGFARRAAFIAASSAVSFSAASIA